MSLSAPPYTIRRARMSGPNARSAPKGSDAVVADLAEKHADERERRVAQLDAPRSDRGGWAPLGGSLYNSPS